ncbi:MAG: hypothetical protein H7231_02055, partial [Rhodoferax sp.]|nr:hypothetical protein [Actinomycetota bacterium]
VALAVQTVGYAAGWAGHTGWTAPLWSVGFLLLCVPFATLLLAVGPTPRQRLRASLAFLLLLYLSWLLADPVYAASFDESLHVTTLVDLTAGDGWFTPNTMLPVSPHYPGLELATGAVHWLTGLPLIACQVAVVAISRAVLAVGLFLLGSRIGHSARVGGLVVLLYAASQQLYFFNAQFSYQTLALAMVVAVPLLLIRAYDAPRPAQSLLGLQACLATLAVTHHLTSWIVLAALWLVGLLQLAGRERARARITLVSAYVAGLVVAGWSVVAVPLLVPYLGPVFGSAGEQVARLIALDGGGRQVASGSAGDPAPLWEVAVMFGSVLLWCVLLAPALLAVLRGRTLPRTPLRWLPLALGAAYPLTLLARFSPAASEVAERASTFVMLAAALTVALWLAPRLGSGVARLWLAVPAALVLLLGSAILGAGPDWQRGPGPYLAAAEHRSVDAETLAVAEWAGRYLPAGSRIAADTTMSRVLPTVAPVDPVTSSSGSVNVTPLFLSTSLADADEVVRTGQVDFVVVDTRLEDQPLRSGSFFEGSNGYPDSDRLDADQLEKFDGAPGYVLVLDGSVRIYDVRALRGESATFTDRADPGLPGDSRPWQSALVLGLAAVVALLLGRRTTRSEARDAWLLAVSLPALACLGVMATATGFSATSGLVVALLVVSGVALAVLRCTDRVPWSAPGRRRWVGPALVVVVLLATTTYAAWSAWHGLFDHTTLPAPLGWSASAGGER